MYRTGGVTLSQQGNKERRYFFTLMLRSRGKKSFATNAFLITDDDIIICDPEAEYFSLVQRLNGQVIRLSPTGRGIDGKPQYVNPMDINLNYSEDDNPLALKSDFILSLCELVIGGKEGLQPVDKTVIDRAVRKAFPYLRWRAGMEFMR